MDRIGKWMGAVGAAMLCAACSHNVQTATRSGDLATGGEPYTVQIWSGNKKAAIPFPQQPVSTSLHWAEADEGVIHWNQGFASNTQAKRMVKVSRPHGPLNAVRVALDNDPAGTGPALVVDSIAVSSSSGPRYVCMGREPTSVQPGTTADLNCARR
jgi:hypothetical protein